jgi:hypothetical protein
MLSHDFLCILPPALSLVFFTGLLLLSETLLRTLTLLPIDPERGGRRSLFLCASAEPFPIGNRRFSGKSVPNDGR